MQSSGLIQNLLVIKSRSSPDVTLDDYRLINYCVPPTSPSFMTGADVSSVISLSPAVEKKSTNSMTSPEFTEQT